MILKKDKTAINKKKKLKYFTLKSDIKLDGTYSKNIFNNRDGVFFC